MVPATAGVCLFQHWQPFRLQLSRVRDAILTSHACIWQVKRRWDDDVVFRNQTRGEPKAQKRFINDTIRNDFHKRFLSRYIK